MGANVNRKAEADVRLVMDALRRVVQALRVSSRRAEVNVGLSGAQLFVLSQLREGKQLSVNDLAERTATHQSSVSVVVDRLVKRGLVQRSVAEDDARRRVVELTERGAEVLRAAPDPVQERLISALQRMDPAVVRQLATSLDTWTRSIHDDETPPVMFGERTARARVVDD